MAKSKNSPKKSKDSKGKKDKKGKGKPGKQAPIEPPKAPYIPYDFSKPPKEHFSLQLLIGDNVNLVSQLHSQSTPTLLPCVIRTADDLCAPPFAGIPAFKEDSPTDKPHVCLWEYLSKDDLKILAEIKDNREESIYFLASKLPEEPNGTASDLLFELLFETVRFSRVTKMNDKKTAALLSIVYLVHGYFKASLWRTAEETYEYVKEAFLLHTIQRPPKSAEIFEPEECRSALLYFCKMYLRHLPLLQLTMMPNYQLRLEWKPEPPPEVIRGKGDKEKDKGKGKGKGKDKKGKKKK